jgi:hypothetical protein
MQVGVWGGHGDGISLVYVTVKAELLRVDEEHTGISHRAQRSMRESGAGVQGTARWGTLNLQHKELRQTIQADVVD